MGVGIRCRLDADSRVQRTESDTVSNQMPLRCRWSIEPGYRLRVDFAALPSVKDGLPLGLESMEAR
jgi:hypothetical protein